MGSPTAFELPQHVKSFETELLSVSPQKHEGYDMNCSNSSIYSINDSTPSKTDFVNCPTTKAYQEDLAIMGGSLGDAANEIKLLSLDHEGTPGMYTPSLTPTGLGPMSGNSGICSLSLVKCAQQQECSLCFSPMDVNSEEQRMHNVDCMQYQEATSSVFLLSKKKEELESVQAEKAQPGVDLLLMQDSCAQYVHVPQSGTSQEALFYKDTKTENKNCSLPTDSKNEPKLEEHCIYSTTKSTTLSELSQTHSYVESSKESSTTATEIPNVVQSSKNDPSIHTRTDILKEVSHSPTASNSDGIIVAIDNSNIYIGAQECASAVNPGDRKGKVRVKLQNLVRILEQTRSKARGFAYGSSPPATEQVWDVYRYDLLHII